MSLENGEINSGVLTQRHRLRQGKQTHSSTLQHGFFYVMLSGKESCIQYGTFVKLKRGEKSTNIVFKDTRVYREKKFLSKDIINTKIQDNGHLWGQGGGY